MIPLGGLQWVSGFLITTTTKLNDLRSVIGRMAKDTKGLDISMISTWKWIIEYPEFPLCPFHHASEGPSEFRCHVAIVPAGGLSTALFKNI